MKANGPKITALLFRRVGDTLLATPALRATKREVAGCRLRVIAEPQVARVFAHNPWIDEIDLTDRIDAISLSALIRRGRPDAVIDFLSDPRSALATFFSGARLRAGFAYPWRNHLYSDAIPLQNPLVPVYSAIHKLELVAPLGVTGRDTATDFYLTTQDIDFAEMLWSERRWQDVPVTAFFVHSRRDYKRWPLQKFAEVIDHLREQDRTMPLILSTPEDREAVEMLTKLARLNAVQVVELRDLGHLGAVLARCTALIGNDGGPKHVAVAVGTPTLTIFRDERPEHWTPPGQEKHLAIAARPGQTISDVDAQEVIEIIERHLLAVAR